jgi:hypothetical protein
MDRPNTFTEVAVVTSDFEVPRLCVSDALRGMKNEVRLFTPALLITHGGFDRDPVREFDARFPAEKAEARPFVIDLQRDHEFFFRGLGVSGLDCHKRPINWDKRLYAISAERAEECFEFIGGIAFSDPHRGYYANALSYDLKIKDPTAKIVSSLDIKIFGVLANTFVAYMQNDFVAPRAIRVPINGPVNFGLLPGTNLSVNPVSDDDPLKMRDQ